MNRIFNLQKRTAKSSDYSHHKTLGIAPITIISFTDELLFLTPILDQGSVDHCTAYASVETRQSMKGVAFDPQAQWQEELSMGATEAGTDVQTTLATGVSKGFVQINATTPTDNASCYLWITQNSGNDLFDSIRNGIQDITCPVIAGVDWMNEWTSAPQAIINTTGATSLGGHCIKVAGWKTIQGEPYLVIQNSWGTQSGDNGLFYFSRDVVNATFGSYGIGYWSDDPNAQIKTLGFFGALLVNLVNLYHQLITIKQGTYPPPQPTIPPPQPTMIEKWASAIAVCEHANPSFCNPGNLKISTLTQSWGASPAFPATDGGSIAKFPTYNQGEQALINFLTLGCQDELKAFHQARTLEAFTNVYAGNPPASYLESVCKDLNVLPTTDISTFLS